MHVPTSIINISRLSTEQKAPIAAANRSVPNVAGVEYLLTTGIGVTPEINRITGKDKFSIALLNSSDRLITEEYMPCSK
jgi:hypothetical protein